MSSIFHRVSIRKYQDKPVEQEKIEQMLRAAMAAPSACNQQPWEYYVVTDRTKIVELSGTSPYTGAFVGICNCGMRLSRRREKTAGSV